MARRRVKKRTQVGARKGPPGSTSNGNSRERTPKSMVIRIGAGEVGPSVTQLVRDVRRMMEPETAIRLKERRSNSLRDYTTMAGPLGVTHLLLFSRSASGNTNMRLAITPRGPTLHFRVEKYSLCKDVIRSMKHPKTGGRDFLTAPLLVMNNFISPNATDTPSGNEVPKRLETLATTVFQSLFAPISPQSTPLASIRRVLLLNRETSSSAEDGTYTINLRHYAITTKPVGIPRSIRRLKAAEKLITSRERQKKGLPNLGRLEDVAEYLLDPSAAGFTSGSDSEVETDAEVEVLAHQTRKVLNGKDRQRKMEARAEAEVRNDAQGATNGEGGSRRTNSRLERRAVKLVELGPRMKLRLTKVEEGLCGGKVMWHEFVTKSKEEVKQMDEVWDKRRKEKEERKRIQRENVERKRKERAGRRGDGSKDGEGGEADDDMDELGEEDWDSDMIDADEYADPERHAASQEDSDDGDAGEDGDMEMEDGG